MDQGKNGNDEASYTGITTQVNDNNDKEFDYIYAKKILIKAYKQEQLKSSEMNKKNRFEKMLRTVAEICKTKKSIELTDESDCSTLKDLYGKLGKCAFSLRKHRDATKFFLKQLQEAEKAGESGKPLIPIYISLYQSYKEMGEYEKALSYYEKEYELNKHDPRQAFNTMYYMADTLFLAKRPYEHIEQAYFKARRAAQQWGNIEAEIAVLKKLLEYQQLDFELIKMDETKRELDKLGYKWDNPQEFNVQQSSVGDGEIFGEDICIETLTDYSDSEECVEKATYSRRRSLQSEYKLKINLAGETELHRACIAGDVSLVRELLDAGHPVLVTDNAKWTPLHEAAANGFTDIVTMLIQKGANLNDKNDEHITPLQEAARNGHLEVIELLIENGAKRSVKTPSGEKAIDLLKQWREENPLEGDEEILYKRIYNILKHHKHSHDKNSKQITDPKTPVKDDCNQPSTNKRRPTYEEEDSDSPHNISATKSDDLSGDEFITQMKDNLVISIRRKRTDSEKPNANENKTHEPIITNENIFDTPPTTAHKDKTSTKYVDINPTQTSPLKLIKVKVEDKWLLIPVKKDTVDQLKINWLINEAKYRYYKITGKLVEFFLTMDDAIISEGDPLSLVQHCNELSTIITHTNTSNVNDVLDENSDVTMDDSQAGREQAFMSVTDNNNILQNKEANISQFLRLIENIPEQDLNAFWSQAIFVARLYSDD